MLRTLLFLLALSSQVLPAAVLFSNASAWTNNGDNVGSAAVSHLDGSASGTISYDAFSLGGDAVVNRVSWRGIYLQAGANGSPNSPNWGISIFADNGGAPGNMVSSTTLSSAQVTSQVLGTGLSGANTVTVYEFTANINAFNATAGTTYWFSPLSASSTATPAFAWIAGPTGNGTRQQVFSNGALGSTGTFSGDRAFSVSGDASTPEPSTAVFVLCGLAGLAIGRNRRNR